MILIVPVEFCQRIDAFRSSLADCGQCASCHVIDLSPDQKNRAPIIQVNGVSMHIDEQKATAVVNRLMADWMIERSHLDLPAVRKATRIVHTGRRSPLIANNNTQTPMFTDASEV